MNAADLVAALELPADARVNQRVPKKLLVENGAPTAADKRRINDGIEEIQWLAALKPTTVGVPAYVDSEREYLEIAVLSVALRPQAKAARLGELVHRAVPYPVVLILAAAPDVGGAVGLMLSLAHKRWSQGEAGKVVLDGEPIDVEMDGLAEPVLQPFLSDLALAQQPRATLYALYQGWLARALALQAARITGVFVRPGTTEQAAKLGGQLTEYERLQRESQRLRAQAAKEQRMNRLVELNLEIKRLEAAARAIKAGLYGAATN